MCSSDLLHDAQTFYISHDDLPNNSASENVSYNCANNDETVPMLSRQPRSQMPPSDDYSTTVYYKHNEETALLSGSNRSSMPASVYARIY